MSEIKYFSKALENFNLSNVNFNKVKFFGLGKLRKATLKANRREDFSGFRFARCKLHGFDLTVSLVPAPIS